MKKKSGLLLFLLFLGAGLMAQTPWTVKSVPNTRLESNDIHVSDPDGFLSDSVEMRINTALCAIRDQADVFVVTLASIGEVEPKHFATELLNYWGIGDDETNNGVLLLFVEDQHALEFETGYGAEVTLTDAKCERIFTKTIVPYFRAGDYEGGLCAGVADIVEVYGGEIPVGLKMTLPSGNKESDGVADDISVIFMFFALLMLVLPIFGLAFWVHKRKDKTSKSDAYSLQNEGGAAYVDGFKTAWSGSPWEGKGCLGGLMIGFSIFVLLFIVIAILVSVYPNLEEKQLFDWASVGTMVLYLTWICFRHNHRVLKKAKELAKQSVNPKSVYETAFKHTGNKIATWMAPWLGWIYYLIYKKRLKNSVDCQCPMCSARMKKDTRFALPENHADEERVEALKFRPYRCDNGHVIVVKEQGRLYSKFKTCSKCGAYTLKLTNTDTLVHADYTQNGKKQETYVCQHCGETITKTVVIPKLVHYSRNSGSGSSYSSSSSGRSYSSHSSSHSSRGSFGGGRSGGGGYSGRW